MTTETIIVGADRKIILSRLQEHFTREFHRFGTLKESDILLRNYEVNQAWTRIIKHINKYPNQN